MPPEPLVLSFDTSVAHCAAALVCGDQILAERREMMAKGQAERLFGLLELLLADASAAWSDLACIGVGIGPGNFTGVRISVSAARGLAMSLDVPAVGVSTLEAQAEGSDAVVVSVLDAMREKYYLQVFGGPHEDAPVYCDLSSLPNIPAHPNMRVIGFDAARIADQLGGQPADPACSLPVAIAKIANRRMDSTNASPAPLYLRAPVAAPPRHTAPVILP